MTKNISSCIKIRCFKQKQKTPKMCIYKMCIYMLTEINQDLYDCIANTVDISLLNTAIKDDGFFTSPHRHTT